MIKEELQGGAIFYSWFVHQKHKHHNGTNHKLYGLTKLNGPEDYPSQGTFKPSLAPLDLGL